MKMRSNAPIVNENTVVLKDGEIKMENTNPGNTDPWNQIISELIKSPSPIIAAIITAIIAGLSAYIAWRSYKNSLVGTPPELLRYDKWLDIMKKRKEILDEIPRSIKKDKFSKEREESFVRTLELYERNAIWEGEVVSSTPIGSCRKCLLRLEPQVALGENILNSGRFSTSLFSYIPVFLLILFNVCMSTILFVSVFIILIYLEDTKKDVAKLIIISVFLLMNASWGIVFSISFAAIKGITVSISILYYHKIRRKSSMNFPSLLSILSRSMYLVIDPSTPLFPLLEESLVKLRSRRIFTFLFIFSLLYGLYINTWAIYNAFINYRIDDIALIILSVLFVYVTIYILYMVIKNNFFSNTILGEYELSLLNGRWKFFYQKNEYAVIIKDGEINVKKLNGGAGQSSEDKKLSVYNMKRAIKGKTVTISKDKDMTIKGVSSPEGFNFTNITWNGEEMILMKN